MHILQKYAIKKLTFQNCVQIKKTIIDLFTSNEKSIRKLLMRLEKSRKEDLYWDGGDVGGLFSCKGEERELGVERVDD